jgi:hypothetical protein
MPQMNAMQQLRSNAMQESRSGSSNSRKMDSGRDSGKLWQDE